jgi:hypothetical protein
MSAREDVSPLLTQTQPSKAAKRTWIGVDVVRCEVQRIQNTGGRSISHEEEDETRGGRDSSPKAFNVARRRDRQHQADAQLSNVDPEDEGRRPEHGHQQ